MPIFLLATASLGFMSACGGSSGGDKAPTQDPETTGSKDTENSGLQESGKQSAKSGSIEITMFEQEDLRPGVQRIKFAWKSDRIKGKCALELPGKEPESLISNLETLGVPYFSREIEQEGELKLSCVTHAGESVFDTRTITFPEADTLPFDPDQPTTLIFDKFVTTLGGRAEDVTVTWVTIDGFSCDIIRETPKKTFPNLPSQGSIEVSIAENTNIILECQHPNGSNTQKNGFIEVSNIEEKISFNNCHPGSSLPGFHSCSFQISGMGKLRIEKDRARNQCDHMSFAVLNDNGATGIAGFHNEDLTNGTVGNSFFMLYLLDDGEIFGSNTCNIALKVLDRDTNRVLYRYSQEIYY